MWLVELDPTRGREQQGKRPGLVISANGFNKSPADLVVVVPITSKDKSIPWHVAIAPPEGGVKTKSFVMCEAVRSVSKERFVQRFRDGSGVAGGVRTRRDCLVQTIDAGRVTNERGQAVSAKALAGEMVGTSREDAGS